MPRELITIQVGQCGNQLGSRFWELALREHAAYSQNQLFDDSLSSFFRNVDTRFADPVEIPVGRGDQLIRSLKARAICIDMEEGVLNQLMKGPLSDIFDQRQWIHDVSGAGNNWAHGYCVYGEQYAESILECVRRAAEPCDSLQSFFIMHSLGGGTGSGVGSYLLHLLHDEYPDTYRFTTAVFPSQDDDVITSPYNSVLSLSELTEYCDCVLPVENQALIDIVNLTQKATSSSSSSSSASTSSSSSISAEALVRRDSGSSSKAHLVAGSVLDLGDKNVRAARKQHLAASAAASSSTSGSPSTSSSSASSLSSSSASSPPETSNSNSAPSSTASASLAHKPAATGLGDGSKPFDQMNTIAAHLLTNLTCSMRFEGSLNVDLNEITMNLVPFPRMHYLISSLSPFAVLKTQHPVSAQAAAAANSRSFTTAFNDLFSPHHQLLKVDPRNSRYLACGLLSRGDVLLSDLNRSLARMKPNLNLVYWNGDGFKVGHCSAPPVGQPYSMLCLSNNCCMRDVLQEMNHRFLKLYRRQAHVHHYTQYMDAAMFDESLDSLQNLILDYQTLQQFQQHPSVLSKNAGQNPTDSETSSSSSILI